jgi:class 3 adenylate cyclase
MTDPLVMRRGAVAMLDILGFRGVWRAHSAEAVVARLEDLFGATVKETRDYHSAVHENADNFVAFAGATFLSDTFVFGITAKSPEAMSEGQFAKDLELQFTDEHTSAEAIRIAAMRVAELQRQGLQGDPPFAFRGCIAFGEFGLTDRFLIGPAVDEAASGMNAAHGAVVWLAPSADAFKQTEVWWSEYPLMTCAVPTKNPKQPAIHTKAVVPLAEGYGVAAFAARYDLSFVASDPSDEALVRDVAEKKANSLRFLTTASESGIASMLASFRQAQRP